MSFEDPKAWANLTVPRVDKRLSPLDVHQTDRRPPRKSPDGSFRVERRGPEARARRAARQAHRKANSGGSFRQFLRTVTNQLTKEGVSK